jgi:Na+/H+-dicarboxylate symporter
MKRNWLLYLMIIGILLGVFCGWFYGETMLSVGWLGDMFLDALKMLVVPLIISSMVVGISGLGDIRNVGKTGLITLTYFMATTGIAVGIGLVLVNIMKPGVAVEMTVDKIPENVAGKEAIGITDILQSFVSPNLIQSMANMEILPLIIFSLVFGGVLTTL